MFDFTRKNPRIGVGDEAIYNDIAKMSTSQRQNEKAALTDTINKRFEKKKKQSQSNMSETSMLKGHEASEGARIYALLKQHYKDAFQDKGSVDNVLKDLENYIISKLGGNQKYITDIKKREYDPHDPLEIMQLKGALRTILDDAPFTFYGSFLHAGSQKIIGTEDNAREMLAYFWLAASDVNMPLDASLEAERDQCIEEEKMMVIFSLLDIRREHNDGRYAAVDRIADEPTCPAGVWGKIVNMHVHNNLTKMKVLENPILEFENKVVPFIIEKFKKLDLKQQLSIINSLNYHFANALPLTIESPLHLFMNDIVENQSYDFFMLLQDEFGKSVIDKDHARLAYLSLFDEIEKNKKNINADLFNRLQEISLANLIEEAKSSALPELEHQDQINQILIQLKNISQEMNELMENIHQISNDVESDLINIEQNNLVRKKIGLKFVELQHQKKDLENQIESLAKNHISVKAGELIKLNLSLTESEMNKFVAALSQPKQDNHKQLEPEDNSLPPQIALIEKADVLNSQSYQRLFNINKNVRKLSDEIASERAQIVVVENLIKSTLPPVGEDDFQAQDQRDELAKNLAQQWFDYHQRDPQTQNNTAPDLVAIAEDNDETEDTLALDPAHIREKYIDKAIINPQWYIRSQATFEDLEEAFALNDAILNKELIDKRQEIIMGYFNQFMDDTHKVSLFKAENALSEAIGNYFEALNNPQRNQTELSKLMEKIVKKHTILQENLDYLSELFINQFERSNLVHLSDEDKLHLFENLRIKDKIKSSIHKKNQDILLKMSEREAQVEYLTHAHHAHQDVMSKAKSQCMDMAVGLYQTLGNTIFEMKQRNPSKDSIAAKQLHYLEQTQKELSKEISKMNNSKDTSIERYHQFGKDTVRISEKLDNKLQKVGFPGRLRTILRDFKNNMKSLFQWIGFDVKIKPPKELSPLDVASIKVDRQKFQAVFVDEKQIKKVTTAMQKHNLPYYENRKKQLKPRSDLTEDELILARNYIQSHSHNPEKLDLDKYLNPNVTVNITGNLTNDPITLRFDDKSSNAPPQFYEINAATLKEYAHSQKQRLKQRKKTFSSKKRD